MKQHLPDQNDGSDGHQHGTEKGRAKMAFHRDRPFQPERQSQRQQHRQRYREADQDRGVLCAKQKSSVLQQAFEVLQPHKFPVHRPVHQAVIKHHPKGQDEEKRHTKKTWKQEEECMRFFC